MSNVRRGAFALVLAAFISAPSVASAETPIILRFSDVFTQQMFACGPNGEPGLGNLVTINGNSDVTQWQKLVTTGEWDSKMKVTQKGSGQDSAGNLYDYRLDQTSKMNLLSGSDTVIVLRSMLTRQGTTGSPYDLAVKSYLTVRQNANGTTTVSRSGFEIECQ